MSAVSALPHLHFALLEDSLCLYIVQQGTVALFVMLLDLRNGTELLSQIMEALLIGGLRESVIHIRPFIVLARGCGCKILRGVSDAAQLLEPHLGMLLLVVRCLQKQRGNLLIAFLLRLGREVGVLVACL